ncbi:MAG: hypothetical protein AB1401_11200 [Thermodesulfobacteriota bacterium]
MNEYNLGSFNKEHVIPELLGTFKNNLTLRYCVCANCNDHFGRHLEPVLAEGSLEAIRRLNYRVKQPKAAKHLRYKRIKFTLEVGGDWNGVILELQDEGGVLPIPQVGFARKSGQGLIYVSESDLSDLSKPLQADAEPSKGGQIIYDSEETKSRLIGVLETRRIKVKEQGINEPPAVNGKKLSVNIQTTIDKALLRCVAKIAFNYMTKVHGDNFAVRDDFDVIRSYIRYGASTHYPLVEFDNIPILYDNGVRLRQTNGHLVTVNWTPDNKHIVAQVSPFNEVRYRVSLARNFSGLWRELKSGHLFDIETRKIKALFGVSKTLLLKRQGLLPQV